MRHGNNPETATAFVKGYEMQGSNLHTNGESIYSYSTPIANKSKGVILLKNLDYSHTTQRHKLHIRRSAHRNGVQVYEVPTIFGHWYGGEPTEADHKDNYLYMMEEAATLDRKAEKATKHADLYRDLAHRQRFEAERYARIFNVEK